jgi:Ribbon-helix-helix domain
VRWSLKVSRETDLSLRTYLGARGMKKGDLSKFVEEAVRWRILDRTVREIKARNRDSDADALLGIVDDAVRTTRRERGVGR